MVLYVRAFPEEHGEPPLVLVSTRRRSVCRKSIQKAVRDRNGTPVSGLLKAMVDHDDIVADLDLLVQHAFELGREYEKKQKK